MTVWVVVSDCGLNGPWVHGVYTTEPDEEEVRKFTYAPNAGGYRVASTTGYGATHIIPFELDGPLS